MLLEFFLYNSSYVTTIHLTISYHTTIMFIILTHIGHYRVIFHITRTNPGLQLKYGASWFSHINTSNLINSHISQQHKSRIMFKCSSDFLPKPAIIFKLANLYFMKVKLSYRRCSSYTLQIRSLHIFLSRRMSNYVQCFS